VRLEHLLSRDFAVLKGKTQLHQKGSQEKLLVLIPVNLIITIKRRAIFLIVILYKIKNTVS